MNAIEKFQDLLKELFQFEVSDLDFGIYRILNYKRGQIERFINEDLVNKVEQAFARHKSDRLNNITQEFEEKKEKIIKNFGKEAFTSTGDLRDEFKNTPLGKEYQEVKLQKEELEKIDEIKLQVFNDLYSFFSRYYEDGDFIPQYRYSIKGHRYAIPYNGEEVKLYWANQDQYYIKTGILFRDYTFKAEGYRVIFRTVGAKEDLGSNKATKERFFVLDEKSVEYDKESKTLIVNFQYRELTEEEVKRYQVEGGSNISKQEKINEATYNEVINRLEGKNQDTLKAILSRSFNNGETFLLYQLNRFTAKNTKDYFIYKNLKKFLSEQLEYFIKSEVLSIETLEQERFLDKHITRAKVVREIGESIIDFLSQIENFQKRLWEKKKFVLQTHYVITLDKIKEYAGEEFLEDILDEILNNNTQVKEWEDLGFGKIESREDILVDKSLLNKEYGKLPIDTRYFSLEFKEKLLEKLTEKYDLDNILDGVLIKSENWQALNLLLNKYKEKIQTIYIDPPYNTGSDGFLYRDRYQHSSWLTMMENRLSLAKELMKEDGVIFVSIGDTLRADTRINSTSKLQMLFNSLFDENNFIASFIRKSGIAPRQDIKHIANAHDYVLCYAREIDKAKINKKQADISRLKYKDAHHEERGYFDLNQLDRGSIQYSPSLDYSIVIEKGEIIEIFDGKEFEKLPAPEKIEIWPGGDPSDKRWIFRWSKEKVEWGIKNDFIVFRKKNGKWKVFYKEYELIDNEGKRRERTNPYDTLILEYYNEIGTSEIDNLFGERVFEYPKPTDLVKYLIEIGANKESLILDFFAGSGTTAHAVMKLNKEDGGKRKFILVEMADYFDTVIIPRLKKVAYSFNWKDGKPQDTDGIGVFFKYHYLEQYEDTLDNIDFKEEGRLAEYFRDEYLLKYFLDFETRESPYLLNIEKLKNPFTYKLKINLWEVGEPQEMVIDIPETFNYLLGLNVKKFKVRKNNGIKYLFILGDKEGKDITVVWREYSDNWQEDDFKRDKEFILEELKSWDPHIVYINGQSVSTPKNFELRYIEPEFKRLMEG